MLFVLCCFDVCCAGSTLRPESVQRLPSLFQSIRIAVNGELQKLKKFFSLFLDGLKVGSRAVFISYHSIEDRIVKHSLKGLKNDGKIKILTKKPILPQRKEIIINPKSRSAKLRAIEVL